MDLSLLSVSVGKFRIFHCAVKIHPLVLFELYFKSSADTELKKKKKTKKDIKIEKDILKMFAGIRSSFNPAAIRAPDVPSENPSDLSARSEAQTTPKKDNLLLQAISQLQISWKCEK